MADQPEITDTWKQGVADALNRNKTEGEAPANEAELAEAIERLAPPLFPTPARERKPN